MPAARAASAVATYPARWRSSQIEPGDPMADRPSLAELLRVKPGSKVRLERVDPAASHGHDKRTAKATIARDLERLRSLQDRFWAENRQRLLIVLQGIDAAGKGGTISHVMSAFNPQGCNIHGFKVPTADELGHDFLWRVHPHVPGNGEISIFDRSHYEQVLVVRVHGLEPPERWSRHYDQINAFEQLLVEEGTKILKFFLLISPEEQRQRLQDRFDDPAKRWKFRLGDLDERKRWDDYMAAYREMLERCSTEAAPWFVIPSDHNWFRNLAVAGIVADTLEAMNPQYPPAPDVLPESLVVV
jgi:PPK2 family polyphosphate:nucleotide phosphotransferase